MFVLLDAARNSPFKASFNRTHFKAVAEKSVVPSVEYTIQTISTNELFGSNEFLSVRLIAFISCGIMHRTIVPLDMVKRHMQIDQVQYKKLFHGFKVIIA